jgi:hypothetical protein
MQRLVTDPIEYLNPRTGATVKLDTDKLPIVQGPEAQDEAPTEHWELVAAVQHLTEAVRDLSSRVAKLETPKA